MHNTLPLIKQKLAELVGQTISITAGDDCADNNGIHIRFYGKLEAPEIGYNRYYVRVLDNENGAQGIGFHPESVYEIHKQVYNWEISLKENLKASF